MTDFSVHTLNQSAILYVYSIKEAIETDPQYQRMSDVWTLEKRQLLIDSVLNGYDIPKIYFHELVPARKRGKNVYKYAIIDGKQRLEALWGFIDGKFAIDEDFQYMDEPQINAGGLTYAQLGNKYPKLKTRFDSTSLSIVSVRANDVELIEDMFSRLNEAIPLNAAEKRNALGGRIPPLIRKLAQHKFFTKCLPFTNRRYRHFDLACKFLYFEHARKVSPTYKVHLDAFVKMTRNVSEGVSNRLFSKSNAVLDKMADEFSVKDELLRSAGNVVVYYLLFQGTPKGSRGIIRSDLLAFEKERKMNRKAAESNIESASYDLLEFDRLLQSPNDETAIKTRLQVLRKSLRKSK